MFSEILEIRVNSSEISMSRTSFTLGQVWPFKTATIKEAQILHSVHDQHFAKDLGGTLLPWDLAAYQVCTCDSSACWATDASGITWLLFIQEVTQEPKHSELCSGCNHAREEACPASAHFAPVTDAASLTELGKGISAARSYRLQLHTGNYFCHKQERAMTRKAVFKHAMVEPLLCTIHYCTRHIRLREKTGLGHPAARWQMRPNILQSTTIY